MKADREVMQQALEALDSDNPDIQLRAAIALRKALETEPEPVAWADMAVRGEDKGLSWTQGHFHKTPLFPLQNIHDAILAEREAIAQSLDKQADLAGDPMDRKWAQEMAAAVRARGEK